MAELSSPLVAPPGGVMTDEVGVITGELELRSTCTEGGALNVLVRYAGALDWYQVTGTDGRRLHDARDHEPVHELLVGVLHRPEG
ncbi:MAG: hypothetical protein M3417_07275 [Actinomycetota bacterium]|nr:hypothetical protein [Actinomycetota bacterium]